SQPVCLSAADVNADGGLDIGDAVGMLDALFGSWTPPSPYPVCGVPATGSDLPCATSSCAD
ncbi:MAG: hypothetical protein KDC38_16205, partial [Planctomycetes bacterium]|nr:hypothetical protein [Planctomycetota bacterium]